MPNSINTFKELSAQFTSHFNGGHRYKRSTACLMSIKQWEDETLRSYITRFNKEALSIDEFDDKILVAAFTNGLRKGKFLFSLYKNDPKTMSEVLYRATKYMNAEDALLAREDKPRKRERLEDACQDQGRKKPGTGDRRDERRPKHPGGRFTSFTPLNALLDQVLMQIKDEGALTFPGKLKSDPTKRSRNKYCRFHRDHGCTSSGTSPSTGKRTSETPCWRHKDDNRGDNDYRIVQEGSKDLPQGGPECPANGLCTQDSTKGKLDYWILRGRRETPPPSTR